MSKLTPKETETLETILIRRIRVLQAWEYQEANHIEQIAKKLNLKNVIYEINENN